MPVEKFNLIKRYGFQILENPPSEELTFHRGRRTGSGACSSQTRPLRGGGPGCDDLEALRRRARHSSGGSAFQAEGTAKTLKRKGVQNALGTEFSAVTSG